MRTTSFGAPGRRWLDAAVLLACVAFALQVAWLRGTDLNWDMQNYHVYAGFAFLAGRLPAEFMGAGIVSYLNPLPMLPFYGMIAAGWHGMAIGLVLGLVHSVNLLLLWMICRRLLGTQQFSTPLAVLAMLLGAASPVFLAEIGTSYADILTCIPVLGAVYLLLGMPARGRLLAGGALLGAAVGLKLTNLPFAVAAAAFVFVPGTSWRQRGVALFWLVLGGLLGGALTGGYWAWLLYREFHNPVFPFANAIFRSPDFPVVGHIHRRFLPVSVPDALAFPFYLVLPKNWVYTEVFAPDLRFALATVAGGLALVLAALRRKAHAVAEAGQSMRRRFLGYVVLAWALWLLQFANGRYFLPLSLLVGPALVIVLAALLSARRAVLAAFVCALLQFVQMHINGVAAYGETAPWNDRWISLDVPRKLVERPYLYLSLGMQSQSYLAPFVHPASRFMNVDGMVPLDLDGPGGQRVGRQLAAFTGATRMLLTINVAPQYAMSPRYVGALDADLNRFGLRVDTGDCVTIVNSTLREQLVVRQPGETPSNTPDRFLTILSCALLPAPRDPAVDAARAEAARLFDKIERACPRQFPARWNGVVMRTKDDFFWSRFYVDTDLWMYAGAKQVFVQHPRFHMEALGTPAGLMSGAERVPCERIRWRQRPSLSLDPVPAHEGASP